MKLILKKHLEEQNETYFGHMFNALRISSFLFVLSIKCFIHSFVPFLFTDAVSSKLDCLNDIVRRNK
tara:strand:- start:60 stop:260 length:201 start_codon:yes stop_codon:yes gene_type:complete